MLNEHERAVMLEANETINRLWEYNNKYQKDNERLIRLNKLLIKENARMKKAVYFLRLQMKETIKKLGRKE